LVSKSGKVRVEERERDRGQSSRLLVSAATVSISSLSMLLIGLARQKLVCPNRQASKSPPAEGSLASPDASPGIATWRSQPCVRRCSFGALRPAEGGIASPDVLSSLTSWRSQPCVRRCSSAPCVPPKAALRLTSAVSFERFFMELCNRGM